LVWIKSNGLPLYNYKNVFVIVTIGIITVIGFSSGVITIVEMVKGK
jgi:hypothetical protein